MRPFHRWTLSTQMVRRRLSDQDGIALPMALAVLLMLSITATALMAWSTSNFKSATYTRGWEGTLLAAEGGIDEALATLNAAPDPNVPTLLPPTTTTLEDVSVSYSGTYDPVFRRWTVHSTATLPTPTGGAGPVSRTVQQTLQVRSGPATTTDNPAWGYIYADGTSGCTVLNSGVQIRQPVFVQNSLCINSNVLIYADAGTVQVGGADGITVNGSGMIGVADDGITPAPINELWVDNKGCRHGNGAYAFPCSDLPKPAGQQVSASNQYATIENLTKPPIDLTARYYDAAPGPAYPCGAGSTGLPADFFETNTIVNDVSAGRRELLPTLDYTCTVPGLGTLAWDYNPSGPGTLTIDGTVFIDGDIAFNNGKQAIVNGTGTIYASGNIRLESNTQLCGKWDTAAATCDWANWDPNTEGVLYLAAGHQGGNTTLILDSNSRFQGGLWADQDLYVANTAIAQGPMIATFLSYNSAAASTIFPFTDLPPGVPANPTWQVVPIPGSWREV